MALEDLVSADNDRDGLADWTNGEPDEVESEWYLLQTNNEDKDKKAELVGGADNAGDNGEKAITRRYEFYAYIAPAASIDGENGEAKCDAVGDDGVSGLETVTVTDANGDSQEFDCASVPVVGDYLGAQMGEFNAVAALGLIDNIQNGQVGTGFPQRTLAVGGNSPYQTRISNGALPNGLSLDSETAVLSGTPSKVGVFNFTVAVSDADDTSTSQVYALKVTGPGDVDADNDIDSADLTRIKALFGQVVAAKNPADVNGDLKVNVLDYRKAASLCTLPQCRLVNPAP